MIIIDARKLKDKDKSHEYIKAKLQLPDYYGMNLDALHDCLTDYSGQLAITHISKAGEYFDKMRPVFEDAAEENRELKVLFTEKI